MSTHNICFCGEIRKIFFWIEKKKASYQELCIASKTFFSYSKTFFTV